MLGAQAGPYLCESDWDLSLAWRGFRAGTQYTSHHINLTVMSRGNPVVDKAQIVYLSAARGLTDQSFLSLTVPYQIYGSASHAFPGNRNFAPRYIQTADGVGDTTLVYNRWLLDTHAHCDRNIALGLGFSVPTGVNDATTFGPDRNGANFARRYVDNSIMPGQAGGIGIVTSFQAFKVIKARSLYASGAYLMNPIGQSDTPSPRVIFAPTGTVGNPLGFIGVDPRQAFNSVTDQYLLRAGAILPSKPNKNLSFQIGGRLEGVPVHDLFGSSIGFRRPGYTISLEPGLIYSRGNFTANLTVNHVMQQVRSDTFGAAGDSSFASEFFTGAISYRFNGSRGRKSAKAAPSAPLKAGTM